MTTRRRFTRALPAAAALAWLPGARAQARPAYPTRTVRLVVGFPAGQAIDVTARVIAQKLGEDLGQAVYIDNRAGASGIIAHEFVKNAAPDGYTLLMGSGATLAINPALYRKLPYDPQRDYVPVIVVNSSPMYLATAADAPFDDVRGLIAHVKAHPGQVSYGSGGSGLTQHIAMEMLKKEAGLDMVHIPYKGSPAMMTDLMAGRVLVGFDTAASVLPHAAAGRIKLLGISSPQRSPRMPRVPTIAEQGVPGFRALTWSCVVAPAGTPAAVVEQLNAAVNRVLKTGPVIEYFAGTGGVIAGGTVEETRVFLREELARWGQAVAASGAQVD